MPSRPLLFLYRLACVHQEDRSSSLTYYPSAHSERAIQVHTQERAIQVHGMLVHPSFLNCRGTSRCLAVGTSY